MASSTESLNKKMKLDTSVSGETAGTSSHSSEVFTANSFKNKFQLLLPKVYSLNKSQSKSVITGLKVNCSTDKVEPVVGIFDQKNHGILLSTDSWKELFQQFGNIREFLDCTDVKKFSERLEKPAVLSGFSITYSYWNFNGSKSKVVGIREERSDAGDSTGMFSRVLMQKVTFDVLHELSALINDRLIYLCGMIPATEEIIIDMIDLASVEVKHIQEIMDTTHWSNDVFERIARDCFRKFRVSGNESMNHEIPVLTYNEIVTELCVYFDEWLVQSAL